MDLLVLADRDGVVDMTLDAIARRTNVPLEIVTASIRQLSEPDAQSRSGDEDGRRIVLLDSHRDWGWQIVNYQHYRDLRDEESRRAYFRDKKREQREREKPVKLVKDSPKESTPSQTMSSMSTEASAPVSVDVKAVSTKPLAQKSDDSSQVLIELPLNNRTFFPITENRVSAWADLYPAVDVLQEARNMRGWLDSDPRRRKTQSGILKFCNGWLSRSQDKPRNGNGASNGHNKSKRQLILEEALEAVDRQPAF